MFLHLNKRQNFKKNKGVCFSSKYRIWESSHFEINHVDLKIDTSHGQNQLNVTTQAVFPITLEIMYSLLSLI